MSRSEAKVSMTYAPEGGVSLAGQRLFTGTEPELLATIGRFVNSGGKHLVVTPNVDQVIDLESRVDSRSAFEQASLRLIDGMPLVVLARILGAGGVERNTGADLLPLLSKHADENSWKIAITGGRDEVSREAVRQLQRSHPSGEFISIPFPQLSSVSDLRSREVVEGIKNFAPDIVFLCLGAPKQESWFMEWRDLLPDGVYIGAGAAVDFAAGVSTRAPAQLQRLGMEWVWRLAQEPKRLAKRYLIKGPRFLVIAARSIANRGK